MDRIEAESIRTMYAQMRATAFATVIVTTYMVGVSLAFTPWPIVLGWAVLPLALMAWREVSFRAFRDQAPADANMRPWANAFVAQQALVGAVWGLTMVLFAHPVQPLSIALTLCCLYSIGAGSVTSLAYYPRANVALIAILFGTIFVRLLIAGGLGYILLGSATALFGVTMIAYCRNQSQAVKASLQIRFENVELLEALAHEKAEADEARQQAERASLAKSQFLAAASHDLRQPLYALSLFSASLDELRLDPEGRSVVVNIQDSIGVMESLFDGLLDISKLDAGVVKPNFAAVSVDAIFDRLSQVFHPIALDAGLDLRFRHDGEWVMTDALLLEQVLANLLSNALRYTDKGGVLVAARGRAGGLSLEVWDTGRGITAADAERIFEEFVQLDNLERDRRKGLGLGLAIAHRSALLIGANITLASRPGRGTRFAIVQPLVKSPSQLPGLPDYSDHPAAKVRRSDLPILIVDDDRDVRAALADLLSRWGVMFEVAASAEAAQALVESGTRFGLILADYRLGGAVTGLELILALRRAHAEPVPEAALITGDFNAALIAAADKHGVPVLHKPLKSADLRKMLGVPERV